MYFEFVTQELLEKGNVLVDEDYVESNQHLNRLAKFTFKAERCANCDCK